MQPQRRSYSRSFKAQVIQECAQPGASIANVAMSHSLNTNLVHKWIRVQTQKTMALQPAFISLPLQPIGVRSEGASSTIYLEIPLRTSPNALLDKHLGARQVPTALCPLMDLFSRRIVGWACSRTADTDLSIKALKLAVALRRPMPELLFHSDQGCQYISPDTTNHNAIGLRPANECANVPPSTNSNSPPNGTPWAIREAIRPLLLSNWAM